MAPTAIAASSPRSRPIAAILCATALCASPFTAGLADAASRTPAEAIQPLGAFHGGEAVARDGQTWLTLWLDAAAGAARLAPARVRVAAVEDPLLDAAGQRTGEEVSVPKSARDSETPLMLLRSGRVRAGAVTVAAVDARSVEGLPGYTFRLNGRESRLDTRCEPRPAPATEDNGDLQYVRCRLIFNVDGADQTLLEMDASRSAGVALGPWILGNDAAPRLLFAGDLDRDGRLDLIFDATDHYNLSLPTLFLSSAAGSGRFLRRMSEHRAVGC